MAAGKSAGERVLAIDIGTQSTRAALVSYSGQILRTAASPVRLYAPRPGWAEQDPEEWWSTTLSNVATVVEAHPNIHIAAIAVGAQMHGLVALDGEGRAIGGRSAIWSDKRCADQVEGFKRRSDAGTLATLAGNRPLPAWAGFKMAWLRCHRPDIYAGAAKLLVVKDFVNYRLCGQVATDPSESSGSFLCDVATGQWSDELLDALGVQRSKLPQILSSTTVIGGLGTDAASATGLLAGTPVVAGSGDMMCQLLGAGLTDNGRVALVAGTASILAMAADRPSPDLRVMNLRSASGNWARFGIADAAGVSFRWFVDQFCLTSDEPSPGEPGLAGGSFDRLTEEAAEVEAGSDGLLFFPYLLGERTLGTDLSRASFIGATLRHQRPHFVRAVLEGITLEDRRSLECVCPDGLDEPVRCTGGGAASSLWNQIRADVFGHPVQTLTATEGGIQGAAILAGVGAGWYANAAAGAAQVVRPAETWSPDPRAARRYNRSYQTFCEVHDVLGPAWRRWDEGSPE